MRNYLGRAEQCHKRASRTGHRLVCTDDKAVHWTNDKACTTVDKGCTGSQGDMDHSTADSAPAAAHRGRAADTADTADMEHMPGRTGCLHWGAWKALEESSVGRMWWEDATAGLVDNR